MASSKLTLSGSVDGRAIKITGTNSGGANTIHTGPTNSSEYDEVWLYAFSDNSTSKLTILWGGTTSPDDLFEMTPTAATGLYAIASGLIIKGNATPLVIKAFATKSTDLFIYGYVNRIS